MASGTEAEQDPRALPQRVAPAEDRRHADAAADQERPAVVGRREADAERTGEPKAVARRELREPVRPRADVLEDEPEPPVLRAAVGERARQPRALVRPRSPARLGGEHVELARARIARPVRVVRPQERVLADA